MTRDDIIRLAEEAGVPMERGIINGITYCRFHPAIERFANFVAAAEREACAKVCEENLRDEYLRQTRPIQEEVMLLAAIADCAAAIRARSA
jgi:hypothetical protein